MSWSGIWGGSPLADDENERKCLKAGERMISAKEQWIIPLRGPFQENDIAMEKRA